MAREELRTRLEDQLVEIDMAMLTSGGDETSFLSTLRNHIIAQLESLNQYQSKAA
jgi:hypothetical protein